MIKHKITNVLEGLLHVKIELNLLIFIAPGITRDSFVFCYNFLLSIVYHTFMITPKFFLIIENNPGIPGVVQYPIEGE